MRVAQSGIFALGTGSHSYLEFDLLEHAEPLALVQALAKQMNSTMKKYITLYVLFHCAVHR